MKIADIIFEGNFFLTLFAIFYFVGERLKLVPRIRLIPSGSNPLVDESDILTILEEFIVLVILMNVVWIVSQLIYWKVFRKEAIEW